MVLCLTEPTFVLPMLTWVLQLGRVILGDGESGKSSDLLTQVLGGAKAVTERLDVRAKISVIGAGADTCELTRSFKRISLPK